MQIEIWSVGKAHEPFVKDGLAYYFRKIQPYIAVSIVLLPPPKKTAAADEAFIRQEEEVLILKKLQPQHYLILLDERGVLHDSIHWSKQFQHLMNTGVKTVVLLIGGAYGVTDNIRKQARQVWSLSPLVFPHQLVRLIVAEQVYRSFSILRNSPYHHL